MCVCVNESVSECVGDSGKRNLSNWFSVQVVQNLPLSQVPVHVAGGVSGW